MFDFDHLSPVKTARITLGSTIRVPRDNPNPVVLVVRHAGDGNPAFMNANRSTPRATGRIPVYERMARLFACHVVVDWENVAETYTPELGEQMLLALIRAKRTDVLDYLSAFTSDADNFTEPMASAVDLGKA